MDLITFYYFVFTAGTLMLVHQAMRLSTLSSRLDALRDAFNRHCKSVSTLEGRLEHAHRRITGLVARNRRQARRRSRSPRRRDSPLQNDPDYDSDSNDGILGVMLFGADPNCPIHGVHQHINNRDDYTGHTQNIPNTSNTSSNDFFGSDGHAPPLHSSLFSVPPSSSVDGGGSSE